MKCWYSVLLLSHERFQFPVLISHISLKCFKIHRKICYPDIYIFFISNNLKRKTFISYVNDISVLFRKWILYGIFKKSAKLVNIANDKLEL